MHLAPALPGIKRFIGAFGGGRPDSIGVERIDLYRPDAALLVVGPVEAFAPAEAPVGRFEDADAIGAPGAAVRRAGAGKLVVVHLTGADIDDVGIARRKSDRTDRQNRKAGRNVFPGIYPAAAAVAFPQTAAGRTGKDGVGVLRIESQRQGAPAQIVRTDLLPGINAFSIVNRFAEVSLGKFVRRIMGDIRNTGVGISPLFTP